MKTPPFIEESNADYHARKQVSASMIKSMAKGWRWFEAEYVERTLERKESPSMKLGTAIHAAILEPEFFKRDYVICPDDCSDRRTKKHKEWAATVDASKIILSQQEAETVQRCQAAAFCHPAAAQVLEAVGEREKSFMFIDDPSGVLCRVRFDLFAGQVCVDLKTIDDLGSGCFERAVANFRYDLQVAHYLSGFRAIGVTNPRFLFVALETSEPYRCRTYQLCDADLAQASDERDELLREYSRRKKIADWSDPFEDEIQTLFLPSWHYKKGA